MSMVKYILTLFVVFWLTLVILMPKQELYYKLEETLLAYDIVLNEEEMQEGLFGLELKNVSVYVKGIYLAHVEEVTLFSLLFYTQVELTGLRLDDSLKSMLPQETQKVILKHSLLSPTSVSVEALGVFGQVEGKIDVLERKVHLDFMENATLEMFKQHLKKTEKGWIYETSF